MKPLLTATLLTAAASLFLISCTAPEGGEIFMREGCPVCHSFGGGDRRVDLSGVTERRSDVWLREQIENPRIHRRESGMPGFGHLSDGEVEALIGYLIKRG
jgi:cbb3-type cytochrome oxidase cytochrome c subunit